MAFAFSATLVSRIDGGVSDDGFSATTETGATTLAKLWRAIFDLSRWDDDKFETDGDEENNESDLFPS